MRLLTRGGWGDSQVRMGLGSGYPDEIPVVVVRAPGVSSGFIAGLTSAAVTLAWKLLGSCMIYQLGECVGEEATRLVQSGGEGRGAPANGRVTGGDQGAPRHVSGGVRNGQTSYVRSTPKHLNSAYKTTPVPPPPRSRPSQSTDPEWVRRESERLRGGWAARQKDPSMAPMRAARARLPAYGSRSALLGAIGGGAVTVVCGQTGCGKSTQVPQFVLEDAFEGGRGALCSIICTQPRRIAAVGLAERVAAERGEGVGGSVGYSIRLESKRSPDTRLLFCTAGILLRRLLGDAELAGVSHVVVDEVHERSVEGDLLLLLLRALIRRQGGGGG